jgi:branched-chain amino acid aminotransferase
LPGTWELQKGRIRFRGDSPSIAAASERLPPGAYTSVRTYQGDRIVRLGQHIQRLIDSVSIQGHPGSLEEADVRRLLAKALKASNYPESRLRLTFVPPSLFVTVEPLEPLPESFYRDGVWCVTIPLRRDHPDAKDTHFIATAAAAYQNLPPGAHEGLMVAEDGSILEGLSSNFFAVLGGALHTEHERVLPGITRSIILELCQDLVPVSLTPVRVADLPRVAECFLTSVSRELLPVIRVDDVVIGPGTPGPATRTLMSRFHALIELQASSVASRPRSGTS